jgi:Flp pilus assembly protein TadG
LGHRSVGFARQFGGTEAATAAIEMAFIAPILAFLGAGMVDFGGAVYTRMAVADAAQAGAAYAQINAAKYSQAPCTANGNYTETGTVTGTGCTWNENVEQATIQANPEVWQHPQTYLNAVSVVMSCCLPLPSSPAAPITLTSNGVVSYSFGSAPTGCSFPPATAPTCTSGPAAGTYTQIVASAYYTPLLPYSSVMKLFDYTTPTSFQFISTYLVRVQ